ncbi:immunogenic protein MPT64 [Mycobacterium ulcerans str. Harvey]|uniref:Immunogenic protein MPT64 n=1 Tax=Mycobacterium ulcerans str. Harvey TaxID=1299332 RepID=A0ABN0R9W4_MYCUL|nr:immunogenic protein MPT64 [Mycobacterium ulcerans str. Harvey]
MRHIMMFVLVTFATLFGSTGLAAAAPPKSYCDELKGTTTGEVCKIQMTEPGYTVDISLPSNYPDGKSLESFVRETGEHFLDKAKSSTARDAPYELDITSTHYESAIPPRGTQSVVLKIYQNVGGPRPKPHTRRSIGTRPIASRSLGRSCGSLKPIRWRSFSQSWKANCQSSPRSRW